MYYERYVRFVDKHPDTTSRFKLCAIALSGKRVMSIGYNRAKSDPMLSKLMLETPIIKMYEGSSRHYVSCNIHAETSALKKLKDSKADTLLVLRRNLNGELCMARPCNVCMAVLRKTTIKKIVYSNMNGFLEIETI